MLRGKSLKLVRPVSPRSKRNSPFGLASSYHITGAHPIGAPVTSYPPAEAFLREVRVVAGEVPGKLR
jgi:hypothetical protein